MPDNLEPVKKMEQSDIFLSLVTKNYLKGDYRNCVEIGLAVFMDKPLYLLVEAGQEIPENFKRLARAIEYFIPGDIDSLTTAQNKLLKKANIR